jgi:membrane-associated phospholipid phosphatase
MRCWRSTVVAGVCALVCAVVVLAMGLGFAGDHAGSGVDDVASAAVGGWPHGVLRVLVLPTEPYVLLPVLALVVAWCLRRSRPGDAVFAVLGPAVAVALNTWALKPLFDRWKGDTLVYPSGHTVSLVATLVVVFVLVGGRGRVVTAGLGVVLVLAAAAGMVGLGYHYLTDVVGGVFFAVLAVPVVRRVLPEGAGPPPAGRGRPS